MADSTKDEGNNWKIGGGGENGKTTAKIYKPSFFQ